MKKFLSFSIIALLILSQLILFMPSASVVQAQNLPHVKLGIVNYASGYLKEPTLSQVLSWQAKYTDFFVQGANPKSFSTNNIWTGYTTYGGFYVWEPMYNQLRDYADTNGYVFENLFLHMKIDYSPRYSWSGMDKFDIFDSINSGASLVNGVIADNSGTLTDKTTQANNTTAADVPFINNLYIGYGMPFAEMNFTISTYSSDLLGNWQYWNGTSWTNIQQIIDGTSGFTQDGKITFTPPANWKRTSVNNSRTKYFLRYNVVSATRLPVISRIYGDNLMTGSKARGWDSSSSNIINKGLGELEYNPNPPANATAKFRYQARVTGYWQANQLATNSAYTVNGKRVWCEFRAPLIISSLIQGGYDGLMIDSLGDTLTDFVSGLGNNPENYSDFGDYTSDSWANNSLDNFNCISNKIRQAVPGKIIGGNTYLIAYANAGDFVYREYGGAASLGGALNYMAYSKTIITYDNYLSQYNPTGKKLVFMMQDTTNGSRAFWDRSNRGPIAVLSSHYIAMNDYTYLHYYSEGGWRYDETEDILVYDSRTTTLAQNLAQDNSSTSKKYIYGADFSSFPSTGSRIVKIGDNVIIGADPNNYPLKWESNTMLSTNEPILYSVPAGSTVKFVSQTNDRMSNHEANKDYPSVDNVYRWANYFPAMFVNIGQPDSNGWNGGKRGIFIKDPNNRGNDVYRRDFTNAIVLHKMGMYFNTKDQYDTYSNPIDLGGTYYPLKADGRLGAPISQISLRIAEGAILMKQGAPSGDTTPPGRAQRSGNNLKCKNQNLKL